MAITNLGELKTAVANWLNRGDLTDRIPEFIALAAAEIRRRVAGESPISTYTGATVAEDPNVSGFSGIVRAVRLLTNPPEPVTFITPAEVPAVQQAYPVNGRPRFYTIRETGIWLYPTPDAAYDYEIDLLEVPPELTTDVSTNWVLIRHPDLLLYGACLEAAAYLKDDERVPMWRSQYEQKIEQARAYEQAVTFGGSPLIARARSFG